MLKIKASILTILLLVLTNSIDYTQLEGSIKKLTDQRNKLESTQRELRRTKIQLDDCLKKIGSVKIDNCQGQRSLKQRLADKIRQLQDKAIKLKDQYQQKIRVLVRSGKQQAKADANEGLLAPLKDKIFELQRKLRGETIKAEDLTFEKQKLQRKIDQYQTQADLLGDKIKLLEKAKESIDGKCDVAVNQFRQREQQCKTRLQRFTDKVKELEQSASDKAKDFVKKISDTNKEIVGRIKNFLTGKGPYNKEDQQAFFQFKDRVDKLQTNLKDKVDEIDKMKKQKQEIDFQKRYCRAQLTQYDDQIKQLERQAQSSGKKYYIEEIQKLKRERAALKSSQTKQSGVKDDLYRSVQDKLAATEEKLRQQIEDYDTLYGLKKSAEERARNCEKQIQELKANGGNYNEENARLRQENRQLRKLIQQIYDLKSK